MRLNKLTIYGFKSFLKRTEVILPGNITAIVGPNGSGKSNIADAVRWVLGEQSARTLRGNSMQDVIFNGTTQRKAMNFCEVSLCFDNSDGRLSLPYQEITILRRVYRNGDSEYQLNGSPCRLKDIVDLLRDTGVGREGYSIVGQGRIDEILSQRSEDRRAVFEEAAGISRYRSRKEEAENHLKKTEENLTRVEDVLEELTKLLIPLKSEADAAREYLRLSGLLRDLDLRLYLLQNERLKLKEAASEQNLLKLADSVHELEDGIAQATQERDELDGKVSALQEKLAAAHDMLLQKKDALFAAKEAVSELMARIASLKEEAERNAAEQESLNNRMKLMVATMNQSETGLNAAREQTEKAKAQLEQRREVLTHIGEKVGKLQAEMTEHNNLLMERMNRLQDTKTNLARQSAMRTAMQERSEDLENQIAQAEKAREVLAQKHEEDRVSLKSEEEKLSSCRDALQEAEAASNRLLSQILEKQKQDGALRQSLQEKATRLKTLKELQEGYEGYQFPVKGALQYAAKKGMSGIRGVVAQLIKVPAEYETAMDMALGGAMQHIVTDTQQEAKTLIEYLRQNRLGRATFLPIKTVRGRSLTPQEKQVLNMEGCIGIASELVSFQEEYRGIVESLLGRTVIAKDLQCGIPIMERVNHGLRLVTLQGDVMNAGGSMTGGSIAQKAQNLLGRGREIDELALQVAAMRQSLAESEAQLAALEEERLAAKQRRTDVSYGLQQQEIAVARETEHLRSSEKELTAQQNRLQALREAAEQINESLTEIAAEIERLEKRSRETGGDDTDLRERTDALSAELDKARRERDAAQEAVTDALLLVQGAEHDADALHRDRGRLREDIANCEKAMQELVLRRQECESKQEADRDELTLAERAISEKEKEADLASRQVEETEQTMHGAQDELRRMQTSLEECNALLLRENEKLHRADTQLTRIRNDMEAQDERLWHNWQLRHEGAEEEVAKLSEGKDWRAEFDESLSGAQAEEYRAAIRRMGEVNTSALEEYTKMAERHRDLSMQQEDLLKAKKDLESLIEELLGKMETVFVSRFGELQVYFSECFSRLFGGGYGELSLNDPKDPLNCGIDIIVQPPGKKRQILSLFSGGERALTAIAILFAMLKLKPTPFCILDEIEAALDDANIATYADYLREFSESTQFIVITHRKGTMERADTLFGVAMQEKGVSSLVSVNLTDYEE